MATLQPEYFESTLRSTTKIVFSTNCFMVPVVVVRKRVEWMFMYHFHEKFYKAMNTFRALGLIEIWYRYKVMSRLPDASHIAVALGLTSRVIVIFGILLTGLGIGMVVVLWEMFYTKMFAYNVSN